MFLILNPYGRLGDKLYPWRHKGDRIEGATCFRTRTSVSIRQKH